LVLFLRDISGSLSVRGTKWRDNFQSSNFRRGHSLKQSAVHKTPASSTANSTMGNTLEGAMAMSKAKNFASDAGLSMPGESEEAKAKSDAKIAAKVGA
jgi:hypothetical protein